MDQTQTDKRQPLSNATVAALLMLSMLWGSNLAAVKFATQDFSPLFMAAVRSVVAGCLLAALMIYKQVPLLGQKTAAAHGVVLGLLFGIEFSLVYNSLDHTLASRAVILVYTAPFWVAIMAHFLLPGDRISRNQAIGLLLAFCGVAVLFIDDRTLSLSQGSLLGDLMALAGAVGWAATTVYLKKFLSHRAHPLQTMFYQHAFGAPLLFVLAIIWEPQWIHKFSLLGGISLFYQCVIIAFISFMIWFNLVHKHSVSLLHAFTFFTPLAGVFFSGVVILHEPIGIDLLIALGMVCLGLILVNR